MADDHPITADDVARKQFATAFRGFDQYEVRAFLASIAAELASLHEREKSLRERLSAAEVKPPAAEIAEDELEAALGAEMTRVLHAAREAAAEIRANAEDSVARLLREANDEATRLRTDAESVLARRTEEADAAAARIIAAAEEQAAATRSEAEATATSTVEEAQTRGREMVAEAQTVRERILRDLSRRRKVAATQLEQLLAARERLMSAYEMVRTNLDDVTRELEVVESEARLAADVAGFKAPAEDDAMPAPDDATPEPEAVPEAVVEPEVEPSAEREGDAAPVAAVPVEAVPAEPAPVLETPPAEERRSSSLRLLRRKAEPDAAAPIALDDDVEGVRIIRPEPVAAEPVAAEPEPVGAEPEPQLEPVAAPAEPAPEGEGSDDEDAGHAVEDLFARLRADRAEALAQAEAVLAEAGPQPDEAVDVLDAPDAASSEEVTEPESDAVEEEATASAEETVFERRDAALEPAERALTRALKRALADEQNEVLDSLRRLRGKPSLDALLPSADEHIARYARASTEHMEHGVNAGADVTGGEAPKVDELVDRLAREITDDLRTRLERTLDSTSDDDEALVEAISATYREWKTARSEPLARHHLAAGYAFGAFSAAADGELSWIVDSAEGNCPDCDDNALAGPTAKGSAYPTGQLHPPAHAGCRCLVLRV